MKFFGFIVNPVAGMGGSVGLKGTDGDLYKKALDMGAKSITPNVIDQFLNQLQNKDKITFLTAPGPMGEDYLVSKEFKYRVIGQIKENTTAKDTKTIAQLINDKGVELIIFFGGDGTARDMHDSIGLKIPVIAVPSGVKMFSAVFAINSRAAAKLLEAVIIDNVDFEEREVLDINEDSYRRGVLESKLYGYLKVPKVQNLIQASKGSSVGSSFEIEKNNIALHVIDSMENDMLYLLGPGTTVKAITDELNLQKTLLGIDAVFNKIIISEDVNEQDILELMKIYNRYKVVLSPIGSQGFIIGRGNKQLTPKILKKIGKENLLIIATRDKIQALKYLRIDSSDLEVDNMFKGFTKVIIGYKRELIAQIK